MASLGKSNVLLFGGVVDHHFFDGTWIFNQKTSYWIQVNTSSSSPHHREFPAMALLEESKNVILFSGYVPYTGLLNDTWMFNQSISDWMPIYPTSAPSIRAARAMASIGKSNNILLFGGTTDFQINKFDDTWICIIRA